MVNETAGGSSKTEPQSPSPASNKATSTASLDAGEKQLANSLNSRVFDNCTGRADVLSVNTVAAINCSATTVGPTSRPLAETLTSGHAETWFQNNTSGYTNSSTCADGSYVGTWSHDGSVAGQLGCGLEANGLLRIVWIVDNNQVGIIAEGSNHQALYNWWNSNACAVSAAC
jgi:hypothetical protein